MIPTPVLDDAGELALTFWDVMAGMVGGILSACCVCKVETIHHWGHDGRFHPLHKRCAPRLLEEWTTLVANGEVAATAPTGQRMGAYARRTVTRASGPASSVSLGSPYFRPGMTQGEPWTVVADMPDDVPMICPCGLNEEHARKVNTLWRSSAAQGFRVTFRGRLPLAGWIVDPTGAVLDRWEIGELTSRDSAAKLAG